MKPATCVTPSSSRNDGPGSNQGIVALLIAIALFALYLLLAGPPTAASREWHPDDVPLLHASSVQQLPFSPR